MKIKKLLVLEALFSFLMKKKRVLTNKLKTAARLDFLRFFINFNADTLRID